MGKILLNGYCDETGNSGLNLFDSSQPEFWVGTLLSSQDLQCTATPELRRLLALVGESELHANAMGLSKLEKIADGLKKIYSKNDCRFVFSRINKIYLAKMKFFDYLFDNARNPGVHAVHYGVRMLRLGLASAFCHAISEKTAQRFWHIYDGPKEADVLSLLNVAEQEITASVSDARELELFAAAFRGARVKPLTVFDTSKSLMDSPNTVAFSQLILGINKIFHEDTVSITKFYHDEQNQFGSSFIKIYDYLNQVCPDCRPESIITNLSLIKNFACPLQVMSSQANTGLQLVDAALWLCKKYVSLGKGIEGNCGRLIHYLLPRIMMFDLTEPSMREEVIKMNREIMQRPLTREQMEDGRKLVQELKEKGF